MTKKIRFICNELIPKKLHNLVIDVGCDHGYLGILLLQENKTKFVINIDNKKNPLELAKANTQKYGFSNRVVNLLNEGLEGLSNKLAPDYIVMAGIGATTIINILKKDEVSTNKTTFILQPESHIPKLLTYLKENNFIISDTKHYQSRDKLFTFILARRFIPIKQT